MEFHLEPGLTNSLSMGMQVLVDPKGCSQGRGQSCLQAEYSFNECGLASESF